MNKNITIHPTVAQSAGLILDHLMNTPILQEQLHAWIAHKYPELDQGYAASEEAEGTIIEHMYYAATVQFHSRVLAAASIGLNYDQ